MVRPRSCRVIYYFDTPALGIRHQLFDRVRVIDGLIRRYFLESWKNFTAYATIIDRICPSVIYRWEYQQAQSLCIFQRVRKTLLHIPLSLTNICRRNNFVSLFSAGNFFFDAHFLSVKQSVFFYWYN
jgi:hypothetical protein